MQFIEEQRTEFKRTQPGLKGIEVTRLAGERWRALPEDLKQVGGSPFFHLLSIDVNPRTKNAV